MEVEEYLGRSRLYRRLRAGRTDSSSSATPLVSSKRGSFGTAHGVASTLLAAPELDRTLSERILNTELDEHLEAENAGGQSNHRNGYSKKSGFDGDIEGDPGRSA